MTFDWQAIAVALIILAALVYTGRRAWSRLSAFRASKNVSAPCETGCGSCGGEQKPKPAATTTRTVFVEISRIKSKR
jgi:hypothetical protein